MKAYAVVPTATLYVCLDKGQNCQNYPATEETCFIDYPSKIQLLYYDISYNLLYFKCLVGLPLSIKYTAINWIYFNIIINFVL